MKYKVYMHTSPSGKKYIGLTGQSVEVRWQNGLGYERQPYFYRAINKYGWENIEHKIMAENLSKKEAINLEIELIEKFETTDETKGYNLTTGGESCGHLDKTKLKMSQSQITRLIENPSENIKLSYEIADEIRKLYSTGRYTQKELSKKYKVTRSVIGNIWNNRIWKNEDHIITDDYRLIKARQIREDYETGEYSQLELAKKYDTTGSTVWRIVNNKIWKEEGNYGKTKIK